MSFYEKYLKYKAKYLELKAMIGGTTTDEVNKYIRTDSNEMLSTKHLPINKMLLEEFQKKLANSSSTYTMDQIKTYLHALDGYYHVFHGCTNIGGFEHITKPQCFAKMKPVKDLYSTIVNRLKLIPIIGSESKAKSIITQNAPNYDNYLKTNT